jgi:prepilin-type N-terminal cleavage/methylation domain-containing protein
MRSKIYNHFHLNRYNRFNGFTLVELLFAVVITSLIALTVYASFKTVVLSYEKNDSGVRMVENARAVLEDITINLKATPAATTPFLESFASNTTPIITNILDTASILLAERGYNQDSIEFISAGDVEFTYFIDTSDNQLMRNSNGTVEPLAFSVCSMNFLFFNRDTASDEWYPVWDSASSGMPRSVYIALTVQDFEKRLLPQTYTTLVTLP